MSNFALGRAVRVILLAGVFGFAAWYIAALQPGTTRDELTVITMLFALVGAGIGRRYT